MCRQTERRMRCTAVLTAALACAAATAQDRPASEAVYMLPVNHYAGIVAFERSRDQMQPVDEKFANVISGHGGARRWT